jgi:hypothetical protein
LIHFYKRDMLGMIWFLFFTLLNVASSKFYLVETKGKGSEPPSPEPVGYSVAPGEPAKPEPGNDYSDDGESEEPGEDYSDNGGAGWGQPTTTTTTTTTAWTTTTTTEWVTTTTTPPPCTWSPWNTWVPGGTCGEVTEKRNRECKEADGGPCVKGAQCSGEPNEEKTKILEPCCTLGPWSEFPPTPNKCQPFQSKRSRECKPAAGYSGPCDCGQPLEETKDIPAENCCELSPWKEGPCSVTCGPGTKSKTRECKPTAAAGYGANCSPDKCTGPTSENGQCDGGPCPTEAPKWGRRK